MNQSLILDLLMLVIMVATIIGCAVKGFFSSLIRLVGNLLTIIVSLLLAAPLARFIFETFLYGSVQVRIESAMQSSLPVQSAGVLVQGFVDSLPEVLTELVPDTVITQRLTAAFESGVDVTSAYVIDTAIQPLMVSIISTICFLFLMFTIGFVLQQLERLFSKLELNPLVGTLNTVMGGALGVFPGVINVVLFYCGATLLASFTDSKIPVLNADAIAGSMTGSLFNEILSMIAGIFAV